MSEEPRVELHSRRCTCRGGAWALLGATQDSPCRGAEDCERLVIGLEAWRQAGKPRDVEAFQDSQARAEAGERREFQRFEVRLDVRLERISTWRNPSVQAEDTLAEVIASGGALVRCRMVMEKGDIVRFRLGSYETRAEVMYVSSDASDQQQRVGLKFLDAPLPDSLIPEDAQPLS